MSDFDKFLHAAAKAVGPGGWFGQWIVVTVPDGTTRRTRAVVETLKLEPDETPAGYGRQSVRQAEETFVLLPSAEFGDLDTAAGWSFTFADVHGKQVTRSAQRVDDSRSDHATVAVVLQG